MKEQNKGITLIALVITIIILLILAAISIAMLTGENGLLTKAANAKKETEISKYYEKIELIRAELRLQKKDYEPPTLDELIDEFNSKRQEDWVDNTSREIVNEVDTIILETKEGYIFNVTQYSTLYGAESTGTEGTNLSVTAKDINTENCTRKTNKNFADLFKITWGKGGSKIVEYSVTGNLNFKNKDFSNTQITNLSELELGTYTVTCKVTQGAQTAQDIKTINVTTLATTEVNGNDKGNAIYSEYDLYYFSELINAGNTSISSNAKIMNNINLSNVCGETEGSWNSIGNSSHKYQGVFDGAGNSIDNIYINSNEAGKGLFGYTENANISNITLENGRVLGQYDVGGVIGNSYESNISNCKNNNVTVSSKGYVKKTYKYGSDYEHNLSDIGGIVGYAYNINISNCINSASCESNYSAIGGIVGFNDGNKERTINNCINNANITITLSEDCYAIAGIVGECYQLGKVENSINTGKVEVKNTNYNVDAPDTVGGIVGELTSSIIENCTNEGEIIGRSDVEGIAGNLSIIENVEKSKIYNCINKGNIESKGYSTATGYGKGVYATWKSSSIGGIAGASVQGDIEKCINKGSIKSASYDCTGGIVGYIKNEGNIKQCANYADINCPNELTIGGIVGYTNISVVEECFNAGNIIGNSFVAGIVGGGCGCTTIRNCYNVANVSGNARIGGIIGQWDPYEYEEGYEKLYNCYNIGIISGSEYVDPWVAYSDYMTWDYLYSTETVYDTAKTGRWTHDVGTDNWKLFSADDDNMKFQMLTNLLNGEGKDKWTKDDTGTKNNGYPYLKDNVPE